MGKTTIEWATHTENPVRRRRPPGRTPLPTVATNGHYCEKVSPGCHNCYASALQPRFGCPSFAADKAGRERADLYLDERSLRRMAAKRGPARVFVADMTDLFGSWVGKGWLDGVFAAMAVNPRAVFQVLTKRPGRMKDYLEGLARSVEPLEAAARAIGHTLKFRGPDGKEHGLMPWPIPNVWLGVSVETQPYAKQRVPVLLETPAALRFLSCEPLLGPLDLRRHLDGLDWVIVGGESGDGARPCQLDWVRGVVGQCRESGVPCFVKQLGRHAFEGGKPLRLRDRKGGDPDEWPTDLKVRQFPEAAA